PPINGARRWVSLGPAAFQPSELAKLSLAIWAASYYAKRKPPRTVRELWRPAGALASLFAVLLVLEPDLGTTIALGIMLVGVPAVIAAYGLFAYAGLDIAVRCRDPFGKRLAAGLTVLVCGQAAVNILAVMGAAPLTGIPLPFLSYGGSSLVVLLAGVGILLNIAHRGNRAAVAMPDRSRGDGGTRAAGTRGRGSARRSRRGGDVRRVAGSRRSASGP